MILIRTFALASRGLVPAVCLKSSATPTILCRQPCHNLRNKGLLTLPFRTAHYGNSNSRRILHHILHPVKEEILTLPQTTPPLGLLRQFSTTPRRSFNPAIFWLIAKPIMKISAILSGRGFRKWWHNLPKNRREYLYEAFKKSLPKLIATLSVLSVLFGINYVVHLQDAPITGRRRFIAFTDEQIKKISEFELQTHMESNKELFLPLESPEVQKVLKVVKKIYAANQDIDKFKGKKFYVSVIDDPKTVNAFVLPTGNVFVYKGLLNTVNNEDQLAIILGHELAHVVLSHAIEQMSYTHLMDFIVIIGLAAIWAMLPNDGIAMVAQWFFNKVTQLMIEMPYSRLLENEADDVGIQLAAKACYDVREASAFWSLMGLNDELNDTKAPEFLSTHPNHSNRAETLDTILPKVCELRQQCNCPRLPKQDPRDEVNALWKLHKENSSTELGPADSERLRILYQPVQIVKSGA